MYTNRLIREKSPYLLQHAHNPVDWYPWCDEAFEKAKDQDKLVFLSIGYATCHWCHVMERESFEDENVAQFLNEHFIAIKLDREERPDLDKIYMDAIQAMGTQGGWPLNIFLTPDRKPLTGGTYFPPVRKYGMKSFLEILTMVAGYWQNQREEMVKAADDLASYLIYGDDNTPAVDRKNYPPEECYELAFQGYLHFFDSDFYGFKTNSHNKFPPSMGLSYLMTYHHWKKDPKALEMVEKTLRAMVGGGIYDHIGGGISRYSTDYKWLVPHFEKMLYDNALLISALVEVWLITKNSYYKQKAIEIINYIEREMLVEGSGIACAEDADSEGEEGKFYVYEYDELKSLLGEDFSSLEKFWNITKEGNFEGKNILNENFTLDRNSLILQLGGEKFLETMESAKEKIFNYRSQRTRPLRDDKVLVSWNALYIRSLAQAGRAFQDARFIQNAIRTFEFLENKCRREDGGLYRRYRDNEARFDGNLVDYSGLALAALDIFLANQDIKYFKKACEIADLILDRFLSQEEKVFYETEVSPELIRRSINGYDSVEPSGNSQAAELLFLLAGYGYREGEFHSIINGILCYFNSGIRENGISYPVLLNTMLKKDKLAGELVLSPGEDGEYKRIKELLEQTFLPGMIFLTTTRESYKNDLGVFELLEGREPMEETQLYVCRNRSCRLPISKLDQVEKFCISPESF